MVCDHISCALRGHGPDLRKVRAVFRRSAPNKGLSAPCAASRLSLRPRWKDTPATRLCLSSEAKTEYCHMEKFIQKARKYVGIETIDPYALREPVQAIYVEVPDKSSGRRRQSIRIKYDGMGFIPLDELMKGETA